VSISFTIGSVRVNGRTNGFGPVVLRTARRAGVEQSIVRLWVRIRDRMIDCEGF
jgi:hypothetical protein